MFSVEDLLISHGYKLTKNPPASYENRYDGYRREIVENRSANRTVNGFQREPGACAYNKKLVAKGNFCDNEGYHRNQGRQAGPGYHHDFKGLSTFPTSEGGIYEKPQLAWSSQPKTDKDLAYWRRRGQDFSVLLGYSDKGDSEMKGLAPTHGLHRHTKESQLEVGAGTEYVARSSLQDSCKVPGDYKWQSLRMESWKQPQKLGRQMSDNDREKLLQDLYSFTVGDNGLSSHNKGKSQSLPRVLSPESPRGVEMPSLTNNNHLLSGAKVPSHPPNRMTLESTKYPETGCHFLPLAKPKYGRPLKPPSYELYQQTRASTETSGFQNHQQKDEAVSYLAKVNEPRQDVCIQDCNLEPPVYVPPPSYKSPPQRSMNQHSHNDVPNYDVYFNNEQQHPSDRLAVCHQPSTSTFEMAGEHRKEEHLPQGRQSHSKRIDDYMSSVQYIPFDDPRIRHIKIAHPESLQDNAKHTKNTHRASPSTLQEGPLKVQYDSAFLETSDLSNAVKGERTSDGSIHNSKWLAASFKDQENCALPDQRDSYTTSNHIPNNETNKEYTKGKLSVGNQHMDNTCETVTKVKKFEPGTGMQSKRSSKKKMNETIFCLVSIPVKSESNLPDTDRNNNLTDSPDKNGFDNNGALQEQSLLSMSSTDLELQALTGSMTNKNELQKQELWRPEEFKQMNDLRFIQPTKHRELKYSGSWPGDQYKDQQTQTNFTEGTKSPQFFHGTKPGEPNNKLMTPKFSGSVASVTGLKQAELPPDDRKCRQNAYNIKGQMYLSPSSNSAFSRTATSVIQVPSPKACQNQPCGSFTTMAGQEREASTSFKGDLVKGEASVPCNSRELFGQFLLKPVSRRPWDAISELESFNKELQGQEESTSSEDGVENEEKAQQDTIPEKMGTSPTHELGQEVRPGKQLKTVVPEVPIFKSGRVKSKSESWSTGTEWGDQHAHVGSQCSLHPKEISKLVRPADGSVITETRNDEARSKANQQFGRAGLVRRALSSYASQSNPFNHADSEEVNEDRTYTDFVKLDKSAVLRSNNALEKGATVRLSLTNRNQGHSEPDLRSVGLDISSEPCINKFELSSAENAAEIPQNESLQARAARILGIEVAVESLISSDRAGLHQPTSSENGVHDFELPIGRTLDDTVETKDSSYESRRKCGWTKSSLFVGDRDPSLCTYQSIDQEASSKMLITEPSFEQYKGVEQDEDQNLPCKSVAYQLAERNMIIPSSEKKVRSTSKVIETLQGKLTSPPSRTVMDRLVRMKEVDSVSRMRRLSIKSADSGEDMDEEKQSRLQEERGSKMVTTGAVSKRVISLNENGHLTAAGKKKIDKDFCFDAYDPTKVERV